MYDAIVTALAVFIGMAGHEFFGNSMMTRPIIVAPLVGLLMGDLQTGLAVGASVEAIMMGVITVGISGNAEPALAAGLAAAFSIKLGGSLGTIIPIVFPIAVLGQQLLNVLTSVVTAPMSAKFLDFAQKNEQGKLIFWHFFMWAVRFGLYSIIPFVAVLFGSDAVKQVINNVPKVIMNGLTAAGNLLPAVGMAMLLLMLWRSDIAIWFFVGAWIMSYFNIPLIGIAFIGTIIAILVGVTEFRNKKMEAIAKSASNNISTGTVDPEEEDFFE